MPSGVKTNAKLLCGIRNPGKWPNFHHYLGGQYRQLAQLVFTYTPRQVTFGNDLPNKATLLHVDSEVPLSQWGLLSGRYAQDCCLSLRIWLKEKNTMHTSSILLSFSCCRQFSSFWCYRHPWFHLNPLYFRIALVNKRWYLNFYCTLKENVHQLRFISIISLSLELPF